ncbi:MAG: hypothetical protein EOP88_02740 [Verrucomicrobiaceae bacterium]|nr:MAG: hypothetical protein EOP88_02740 [Verrucomicrobiaceae bacterium]
MRTNGLPGIHEKRETHQEACDSIARGRRTGRGLSGGQDPAGARGARGGEGNGGDASAGPGGSACAGGGAYRGRLPGHLARDRGGFSGRPRGGGGSEPVRADPPGRQPRDVGAGEGPAERREI